MAEDHTLEEAKRQMRQGMREHLATLDPTARQTASHALVEVAQDWSPWPKAETVLFFLPRRDEPDILALLDQALAQGKRCCLPRYRRDTRVYEAAQLLDRTRDLEPGAFGILEPKAPCTPIDLEEIDLTFVPGLAFDRGGCRLGRGRGFYDRLLGSEDAVRMVRCGIAFDFQIVSAVPRGPLDQKMDWMLTPSARWQTGV